MKAKVEFSQSLKDAINHVNQDVVYDLPSDASLSMIAEVCIDAGRIETWGHPEAQKELQELVAAHGYNAVHREAKKYVCQA